MLPWEFLIYLLTWEPNRAEKISVLIHAAVNPTSQEFPYSKGPQAAGAWSRSESTGTPILCSLSCEVIAESLCGVHQMETRKRHLEKAEVSRKQFHYIIDLPSLKPRAKSFGNFISAAGPLVLSWGTR